MSNIKLIVNDEVLYNGEVKIIKDLFIFGNYVFDKTVKRLISKKGNKETIIDIDNKRVIINENGSSIDISISINYYIEKDNIIEFKYSLKKECFNIKIEVGD
jgi:hypothetical protein